MSAIASKWDFDQGYQDGKLSKFSFILKKLKAMKSLVNVLRHSW